MRSALLLLFMALSCSLFSQQIAKNISYGGEKIGFYEYKPTTYASDRSTKYPVIIFLHGIGERGNGTSELYKVKNIGIPRYIANGEPMRFYVKGKWHTFIVLSPQCPYKYGMWPTSYVDAMIDYAEKNLRIDKSRIYLTGLSMGGGGTWKWISASEKNANKVAAIATVCAPATLSNPCVIAKSKLPMWAFHATNDAIVNVSVINNAINRVLNCNPAIKPKKTVWSSGGHAIWDKAYDRTHTYQTPNVFEWFLGYTRGANSDDQPQEGPKPPVNNSGLVAHASGDAVVNLPYNAAWVTAAKSRDKINGIKSYRWSKLSGPSSYKILNPNKGTTKITKLTGGIYVFRLTVTNKKGGTATANFRIKVNRPPVIVAKAVTITLPNNRATVQATQTKDPDGWIRSFKWQKISGPGYPKIESPNTGTTRISNLAAGYYLFRVAVTDNEGAIGFKNIRVIVNKSKYHNNSMLESADEAQIENIDSLKLAASELKLYPNPARSVINIISHSTKPGKASVTIYDISGRSVQTQIFDNNGTTFNRAIDISRLNKGLYVVSVIINEEKLPTQKFLKE